jgi:hypothetical protein
MLAIHPQPSRALAVSSNNGQDSGDRYWEVSSRLAVHEAMCEERSKHIDERLGKIEGGIEKINHWGIFIGFTLICSMAGILVTLLLK